MKQRLVAGRYASAKMIIKRLVTLASLRFFAPIFAITLTMFAAVNAQAPAPNASGAKEPKPLAWSALSTQEKEILQPVATDWDKLPPSAQRKLQAASKHYPNMKPDEQKRFKSNIPAWAGLSKDERARARENFQELKKLPPERKTEVTQKLRDKSSTKDGGSGASVSAPSAAK